MVLRALRDLFVSPRTFFEERPAETLTVHALGAVLLSALATVVGLWLVFQGPLAEMPPEGRRAFRQVFLTTAVVVPVAAVVTWGILTGIVHLFVRPLADRATYGRTFAIVGITALLELLATAVGMGEMYFVFESVSWDNPERAMTELRAATSGTGGWSTAASVAVTLWQGYIWREGLLGAYDVPADRATLAAGVAAGLSVLFALAG